jgi:peptidoglycan/LPS O-acetylase OafA/YrhL
MRSKSVYFPNLNGIRFIAAFLVIIYHVEQFKFLFNLPSHIENPFISVIGKLGVILFFVLSGFLITYLLLEEEKNFNTISIKNFYIRRVLRIWPLYFLIVILALLVLPNFSAFIVPGYEKTVIHQHFSAKVLMYFTFFANLAVAIYGIIPFASQTWSIGTEEQFYLIWPVIIKFIKKHRLWLMVGVVAFYLLGHFILNSEHTNFIPAKMYLRKFWKVFNIDCMAIGGFFAIILHSEKYLKLFLNKGLFYTAIAVACLMMGFGVTVPHIHNEVYSVLFGIIIINFAANKNLEISLEHPWLHYLGKISYGLYMYHILAIVICIKTLLYTNQLHDWLLYPLSIVITIIMASLSYELFESRFIKRKKRYSNIVSGENVAEEKEVQKVKGVVAEV